MSSGEDNSRLDQRCSADKMIDGGRLDLSSFVTIGRLFGHKLLPEQGAHVGPFSHLRLSFIKSLNPHPKSILVPSSTGRLVRLRLRWRRNKMRIFAADVQES